MDTDIPETREHKFDIFLPGDRIPWGEGTAEVVDREVCEEVPSDVPPSMKPTELDSRYVILTVERSDGKTGRAAASALARLVKEVFQAPGLPVVRSRTLGIGDDEDTIGVKTQDAGMNEITRKEALDLSDHLRRHKDFEPLWALLGAVDSADDVERVADALERAAVANALLSRTDK